MDDLAVLSRHGSLGEVEVREVTMETSGEGKTNEVKELLITCICN